jgi:prepilin-type N-terminal cleavage/methylation domain-containing protein
MKKTRRPGYTLLEMMLVCAILVIIGALSVPTLASMQGSFKLNAAVDSVRGAWAEARARAIEEGRPYRFSVEPQGSSYRVAPDSPDYWSGSKPENDPNGVGLVLEQSLPAGVRFRVNNEAANEESDKADEDLRFDLEEKKVTNSNWSTAVTFLPDGTARDDVTIHFQVRGTKPTCLLLRGLTGTVSVQTPTN